MSALDRPSRVERAHAEPVPTREMPASGREGDPSPASPFPPIADYAFLSDCHTGALVAADGSVEWMSLPHFDSPSVFAAMLDRSGGSFRLGPYGVYVPAGRRYVPGTNVLETTWMTPQGWLVVRDALTIGPWHDNEEGSSHTRPPTDDDADHLLVRTIKCIQGQVQVEMVCEPMFGYGGEPARWTPVEGDGRYGLDATGGEIGLRLFSDMRMGIEGNRARARHTMVEGEWRFCAMSWTEGLGGPHTCDERAHTWIARVISGARGWPTAPTRPPLALSPAAFGARAQGAHVHAHRRAVAAPTTSLPETPHGGRNWDYRFCWMRDATFTLWGLHELGLDWEADDFIEYLADLQRNEDGSLQIMYGIRGERDLEERTLEHLRGYEGARPVRVGNGAYDQRQNDVYGAVLDSIYLHSKKRDHIPERLWPVLYDQVECAARAWREPDQGIWEARGDPRHYVSSKLMCWVALDRGARLAERRGDGTRPRAGR